MACFNLADCKDVYDRGFKKSGVYRINPKDGMVFKVFCDMETDGGGWTVIQRRVDDKINFQRNWYDYRHGFGDVTGNLWIGLEKMHILAGPKKETTLRIKLKHLLKGNRTFHAKYGTFTIADEKDWFRLKVSDYSGNAGDAFNPAKKVKKKLNGMKFSTFDRDNDMSDSSNCAAIRHGGWWFNDCHICYLNGLFPKSETTNASYITWKPIAKSYGNIYFSEMKIRRK